MCPQTICGCCGLDHEGSSDAREGPAARCLVLGTSTTSSLKSASSIAIGLLLPLCEQQLVGFQFVRGHVDVIHTTFAQNLSYRLKGGEFVRLTTSEFVSQFPGHLLSKVWSGPKHVVAHVHVGNWLRGVVNKANAHVHINEFISGALVKCPVSLPTGCR